MDIDTSIEAMRDWIAERDWRSLEMAYADECNRLDPEVAADISSIELGSYTAALRRAIGALDTKIAKATAAVYWEFDVDNAWSSAFYECRSYESEAVGDDDWATDFDPSQVVSGPAMPELAARLAATWRGSPPDVARNLYLLARSVAAFGRASAAWSRDVPLCMGFHDQSIVFRVVTGPGVIGAH